MIPLLAAVLAPTVAAAATGSLDLNAGARAAKRAKRKTPKPAGGSRPETPARPRRLNVTRLIRRDDGTVRWPWVLAASAASLIVGVGIAKVAR